MRARGRARWELVFADERGTILSIWRQAFAIIRQYPLATLLPAAVLGPLGDAPYYFIIGELSLSDEILSTLTGAFAFYVYIVYITYAEEVTAEAERGVPRITIRGAFRELRQAASVVPFVLVASVVALAIPLLATTLLVIPGLWLLTRWSLFAPVISREQLGPVAALKRSNEVVGGHFELVFLTATLGTVLEEAAVHGGAVVGHLVTDSYTWGEWLGSSIVTSLVMPLAAIATSVTYMHLQRSS